MCSVNVFIWFQNGKEFEIYTENYEVMENMSLDPLKRQETGIV